MIKAQPTGPPQFTVSRLNQYTLLAAATAAAAVGTQQADAAIIYSGVVNIPIPDNIDGVYIDVDSGATGTLGASTPGWDLNPYNAGRTFFNGTGSSAGVGAAGTVLTNFAPGALIDAGSTFVKLNFGSAASMANFPVGGTGMVGFRTDAGSFGWLRFTSAPAGSAGKIVDYAYEDGGTGILAGAGAIPEPGSMGLFALGAVGLASWRRRKVA